MGNIPKRHTRRYHRLLRKYLDNTCTATEQKWVEGWYENYSREQLEAHSSAPQPTDEIGIRMWSRIELGIAAPKRLQQRRQLLKIAASIAFILVAGYLGWLILSDTPSAAPIPYGRTAATITLDSEGKGMYLDTALQIDQLQELGIEVQYEDGKPFYALTAKPDKTFEKYTISTDKGEEIQIILPDNSRVWINASSKITFDSEFTSGTYRSVHLEGEAYFEVAHNQQQPFRVHAKESTIEVLGTAFNVNAYGDDTHTETTLLKGAIRLHEQILSPGQQATFDGASTAVNLVDAEAFVAWKNGYFNFNGVELEKIVTPLENWYNVKFELPTTLSGERIHGMIPKYQDLETVLNILEKAGMGKFKIEGRRVIIMS